MNELQKRLNSELLRKVNSLLIEYLKFKNVHENNFSFYIKENIRYYSDKKKDYTYFYDNGEKILILQNPNLTYDGNNIKYNFNYNKLWGNNENS